MDRLENKQILGVIDATTHIASLGQLTLNRPVASLPFAGRYRLIDFMLSNMAHAGIDSVGVFSHHVHNSLKGHIGSGKVWDLDRKNGGLFFYVQNEHEQENSQLILQQNQQFFIRAPYQYVIIAPSNIVGRVPILEMFKQHKAVNAEVTQAVYLNEALPIYLLKRQYLVDLLANQDINQPNSLIGFIEASLQATKKNLYQIDEQLLIIDSLVSYYVSNMRLLVLDNWESIFKKAYPVLTKTKDEPPAKYLFDADVTSSIIANGCIIDGKITSSIVSRGVQVGKNTTIRNSIIMPGVTIGKGCVLDGVIVDKDVTIEAGAVLKQSATQPRVVPKGATIYKEWK